MGSTAFGYQLNNGTISYCVLNIPYTLEDLYMHIKNRSIPSNIKPSRVVNTVNNYFSNDMFDRENTNWRILFMANDSVECCFCNLPGKFIYR